MDFLNIKKEGISLFACNRVDFNTYNYNKMLFSMNFVAANEFNEVNKSEIVSGIREFLF